MKRALISVYDKEHIVPFAKELQSLGWELISTGGTEKKLKEENIPVLSVEEVTQFREILGGRVKTLHPHIHGGLLYKRGDAVHEREIEELNISSIDMVVNNLYPFEEVVSQQDASQEDIIENIDIGGPSMIRAAAKNYQDVLIVTDPSDYEAVINALRGDRVSLDFRRKLAAKAFQTTAAYDALIAQYFLEESEVDFPEQLTRTYRLKETLRYGENPQQKAALYEEPVRENYEIKQLHGKAMSYNNMNDLTAAVALVQDFDEIAATGIKHANPSGVAVGESLEEAYRKAHDADPESIYGGVIGLNRPVDQATAEALSETFLEIVAAPAFEAEAFDILSRKKNIRLIEIVNFDSFKGLPQQGRETIGGYLLQERDRALFSEEGIQLMTERQVTGAEKKDLIFAWKVAKHIQSNGMVVAKDGQTLGIGQGEVRRVWALEDALRRTEYPVAGAVVASDGFFFPDTIETLSQEGIKAVIQPGGSIQDEKVIKAAHASDISVLFTGMRHFRH